MLFLPVASHAGNNCFAATSSVTPDTTTPRRIRSIEVEECGCVVVFDFNMRSGFVLTDNAMNNKKISKEKRMAN